MEYSVQINGVSKQYQDYLLDQISFNIPKGTVMGLIGENGSGKTTIMKLLLNLIPLDGGSISVLGFDSVQNETDMKELIGYVPDDVKMFDFLMPKDVNQILSKVYRHWQEATFYDYLEKFELPMQKPVKEFSLGMKKKLSIVVALSHEAQLLILDEPMNGLDPVARNHMLDVYFDFMQNEEHSILISSHIMGDLSKISDYITMIQKGKIVFSENKDILLEDYGVLRCKKSELSSIHREDYIFAQEQPYHYDVFLKNRKYAQKKYSNMIVDSVDLEEIMIYYAGRNIKC